MGSFAGINTEAASPLKTVQIGVGYNLDRFLRFRVSQPETIFDSKQIFDNQPLFWNDLETSGSGTTSVHSVNTAASTIAVSAGTAGTRIRQTYMSFNYQPGKSQLIKLTGVLQKAGAGQAGIKRGFGYGDDRNGLFLIDDEGTIKLVKRSYFTGSAVDLEIPQSDWDDPMDGTGPSGINLDFTKSQILLIDFSWLGVGNVGYGFLVSGKVYYAYVFNNSNVNAGVYMSTPNLPIRYWIENDGSGGAAELDHICSTVISEGGSQNLGVIRSYTTAGTPISLAATNTLYGIFALRLKSTHIGAVVDLVKTALYISTTADAIEWTLHFNPALSAGSLTYTPLTNSALEIALCDGTQVFTPSAYIFDFGFAVAGGAQAGSQGEKTAELTNALRLGAGINGTLDTIVLCARAINGSTSVGVQAGIKWQELS